MHKTVCVIDCGTVQVRAFIAEVTRSGRDNFRTRVLEDIECNVDLSEALRGGILPRSTMDGMVEAIENIVRSAATYGVPAEEIRAVATSAMRECINADAVIEWVLQRTGIELETIDNSEEARLYYLALVQLWKEEKQTIPSGAVLMLDIGSGATVTSLIQDGTLVHSVDEHFGTIRVFEQFQSLNDSDDFISTIDRFTHGAVRMILRRLPAVVPVQLVVTGGEFRQLARILNPQHEGRLPRIEERQLRLWYKKLGSASRREQAETMSCERDMASRLLLVASVLLNLMDETGLLRGGADHAPPRWFDRRFHPPRHRRYEGRSSAIIRHGANDRRAFWHGCRLFGKHLFLGDAIIRSDHFAASFERARSHAAGILGLVHDIGAYINVRNRHKHSMYLLHSVDLPGLDHDEVEMVSHIVRYHRRATPQLNHLAFQALSRPFRARVMILASILRLAYGLDVERTQRVRKVRCEVSDDRLLIHLDRRQIALERWSIEGKSPMFTDVFGLAVVLIPRLEE